MPDILAIDIGGTSVKLALVQAREEYHILDSVSIKTLAHDEPEKIASRIAAAGRELAEKHAIRVDGAGVGCAGLIDNVRGVIRTAVNLPTMAGYALSEGLANRLGVPVALQNDANAAALGEFHFGRNKGCPNMVLLTIGTGIGGGVICDGRLLVGADNAAAELGHVKVEYTNPSLCACQKRGCLEAYAGIEGIRRITGEVMGQNPGSSLSTEMSTQELADAARAGNGPALEVLRRVGIYLGRGIADFIDVFNPEKMIFAGGASRAMPFFMTGIQQSLDEFASQKFTRERCEIVASSLPDTINVLGAAAVFLDSRG